MVNNIQRANNDKIERTSTLIANFINGYAEHWVMAVGESFRMELDIKLTERRKRGVSFFEWTQGPYFCFSEGQIFYNSSVVYSTVWQRALEQTTIICQIVEAKPNIPLKYENTKTGKKSYRVFEGFVRFQLYSLDKDSGKIIPTIGYQLSQADFVEFLKTGKV